LTPEILDAREVPRVHCVLEDIGGHFQSLAIVTMKLALIVPSSDSFHVSIFVLLEEFQEQETGNKNV